MQLPRCNEQTPPTTTVTATANHTIHPPQDQLTFRHTCRIHNLYRHTRDHLMCPLFTPYGSAATHSIPPSLSALPQLHSVPMQAQSPRAPSPIPCLHIRYAPYVFPVTIHPQPSTQCSTPYATLSNPLSIKFSSQCEVSFIHARGRSCSRQCPAVRHVTYPSHHDDSSRRYSSSTTKHAPFCTALSETQLEFSTQSHVPHVYIVAFAFHFLGVVVLNIIRIGAAVRRASPSFFTVAMFIIIMTNEVLTKVCLRNTSN